MPSASDAKLRYKNLITDVKLMLTEIHGRLSYSRSRYGFCVVELGIGDIKLPEAIVSPTFPYFASIPREHFDSLEAKRTIRNALDVKNVALHTEGYPHRVGYADIWVIGTEQSVVPAKLYRNATIVRNDEKKTYTGLPFVHDFDIVEFWESSGRCSLRFNNLEIHVELFDERPDKKEGFYGLRVGPVSDVKDFSAL
jgi:hypothetical protein